MLKPFHNQTNVRFDLEVAPAGLPNLVLNPSGAKGAWFWTTPIANTAVTSNGTALTFTTTVSQACNFRSDYMPVTPSKYVAARFDLSAITASHNVKVTFEWYDANKALLSSSAESGALATIGTNYTPTVQAPASTAYVIMRVRLYNGTGNPSAAAAVTFSKAMVTWSATTPIKSTRTNLLTNPSGEVDATNWGTSPGASVASSIARVVAAGAAVGAAYFYLAYTPIGSPTPVYAGEGGFRVTGISPGMTYAAQLRTKAEPTLGNGTARITVRYFRADGTVTGITRSDVVPVTTAAWVTHNLISVAPSDAATAWVEASSFDTMLFLDAGLFEAATVPGTYFDGATTDTATLDYSWTGTAHASTSTEVATNWAFSEPYTWRNILGSTFEIGIKRSALNIGTLTASITDPGLDPVTSTDVRPGRQVRVQAWDGTTWESVFEGKLHNGKVDYERTKEPGAGPAKAIITLTAYDPIARLANQGEARGLAAIASLPYVLEGKGVPWNVNGSGSQITATPTFVSNNPDASVLDQVAITRDSALGYAWVDRAGVLNVWDAASLGNTVDCTFTDVATAGSGYDLYSDISVDFDTERCINEVTIKFLRYDSTSGETEEVTYGPYRDQTSVDTWDAHAAEFTIHGGAETTARFTSYASQILTANATPAVRANSLRMPVTDDRSLAHAAKLDLYDLVHVTYDTTVSDDYRITDLEHTITPEKWIVDYSFGVDGSVAAPTWTPSPPGRQAVGLPWRDVYRSADQTVATSTFTTVSFDTNRTTAVSMTYSSGTFTVDRPGVYDIDGVITFAGAATPAGRRIARVLVNGAAIFRNDSDVITGTGTIGVPFSCKARLSTGDAITVEAWHNQGANLAVLGSTNQTVATVMFVRP